MNLQTVSIEQLKQVIAIKEEIATLEGKLAKIFGGTTLPAISPEAPAKKARQGMSAAGKAKIAAAQKARWAKVKGTAPVVAAKVAPAAKTLKKRTISPEHKAKLLAAVKARWAKTKGTAPSAVKATPAAKTGKKKGGITPEGRAKIVAALKKRWAKQKA